MWNNRKNIYRRHLSVILLLLIAVRIVPFGLLHYHNGNFASFETSAFSAQGLGNNIESLVKEPTGTCSLHQLLDLINNGFYVGTALQILNTGIYNDNIILYTENRLDVISVNILNKGSPVLV